MRFEPGHSVGARRWPMDSAHPDCWERPWAGTVLAHDDPRSWAGTGAFPEEDPAPHRVRAHVARHRENWPGSLEKYTPVLWHFGEGREHVYWEPTDSLRTYSEDVHLWYQARSEAHWQHYRHHIPTPARRHARQAEPLAIG